MRRKKSVLKKSLVFLLSLAMMAGIVGSNLTAVRASEVTAPQAEADVDGTAVMAEANAPENETAGAPSETVTGEAAADAAETLNGGVEAEASEPETETIEGTIHDETAPSADAATEAVPEQEEAAEPADAVPAQEEPASGDLFANEPVMPLALEMGGVMPIAAGDYDENSLWLRLGEQATLTCENLRIDWFESHIRHNWGTSDDKIVSCEEDPTSMDQSFSHKSAFATAVSVGTADVKCGTGDINTGGFHGTLYHVYVYDVVCDYDGQKVPVEGIKIDPYGNIEQCKQDIEKKHDDKEYILTNITVTDADKNALAPETLTTDIKEGTVTGYLPKAGVTITFVYQEKSQFEKTITYKVSNGKWNDGTTDDKTETVVLRDDKGIPSTDGTAKLTKVPDVGGQPNTGYKTGNWDSDPNETITNNDSGTFTYTYAENREETKPLSYTVNFYKDGQIVDSDTQTVIEEIWVNEPEEYEVAVSEDLYPEDKYAGYKLDTTRPVPTKAKNGDKINVYYVKDENQTKKASYTVKYYKRDDASSVETETYQKEIWTGTDMVPVEKEEIKYNIFDEDHYIFDSYAMVMVYESEDDNNPQQESEIPESVKDGSIIEIIFEKDVLSADGSDINHGDGMPDKYQAVVTFKANHGTVSFDQAVVTLYNVNQDPDARGSGNLKDIPTVTADSGYKFESWDKEPKVGMSIGGNITFTANCVADFSDLETVGINEQYNGGEHHIQVTGLVAGDIVQLGDQSITCENGGTVEIGNYKDVTPDALAFVKVTVTRGDDSTTKFVPVKINPAPLTITTPSATKVYDGQPLTSAEALSENEAAVKITGQQGDDVITATASGSITDVGTADNTYVIDWGNTNEKNYTITEELGKLEVTKRPVTLTSADLSKEDDGTALTNGDAEVTVGGDGWVEGQGVTYTFTGEQQGVGSTENSFTYEALPGTKLDNYEITPVFGTLTVTAAPEDPVPADPTVPTEPTDPTTPDDPTTPADPAGGDGAGGAGADTPAAGAGTPAAVAGAPAAGAGAPTAGAAAPAAGAAAPIAAGAGAAPVVAAADDATPLADIDLNDGGTADAEIVAAEDEEVPLDKMGLESDMEKEAAPMCVFHVLILLAALIVFLIYMVAILRLRRRIEDLKNQ